jgi:hypothetical protein
MPPHPGDRLVGRAVRDARSKLSSYPAASSACRIVGSKSPAESDQHSTAAATSS